MNAIRSLLCAASLTLMFIAPADAGQFLLDFAGTGPNSSGAAANWDALNNMDQDVAIGLTDWSGKGDDDVTITALDDFFDPNNPGSPGVGTVYDGVTVPQEAVDDYFFKRNDTAGTTARMKIENLDPGLYNVTVFEGRTTDPSQFAVVWVGDSAGSGEPASENTGNFAQTGSTISLSVNAGDALWYRHLEDNTGGISGMIINPVPEPTSVMLIAMAAPFFLLRLRRRRA